MVAKFVESPEIVMTRWFAARSCPTVRATKSLYAIGLASSD